MDVFKDLDLKGDKKKEAALRLAKAKRALETAQEGFTVYYSVTTVGEDGIGIRDTPEMDGERTGDNLPKGTIFEVDKVVEADGEPTWLRLKDGRGWVFDTYPIDPETPSAQRFKMNGPDGVIAVMEKEYEDAKENMARMRGARLRRPDEPEEEGVAE